MREGIRVWLKLASAAPFASAGGVWMACVYGFGAGAETGVQAAADAPVSLAAIGYLALGGWLALILRRG